MIQAKEIRDRIPLPKAMEYYGVKVKRGYACCPFHHEKTPSMRVWNDRFYCFGCNEHGSVIDFVMQMFGLDFRAACLKLNEDFCLGLEETPPPKRSREEVDEYKRLKAAYEGFKEDCNAELRALTDRRRKVWQLCGEDSETVRAWLKGMDELLDLLIERRDTL